MVFIEECSPRLRCDLSLKGKKRTKNRGRDGWVKGYDVTALGHTGQGQAGRWPFTINGRFLIKVRVTLMLTRGII